MRYRKLGRTNFETSEIGYGAWGIGGSMWLGGSDDESLAALRRAIGLGLNFIDTALAYGNGHSEVLVGRVLKETKERICVATKVPPKNYQWPARRGIGIKQVFPYEYIIDSTEQSLRNLDVETIDLQQLHVWNPEWLASDDWRRAFEKLKKDGKVRAVGISINDHEPDSALEAIGTGLIDSVQVIYNIFDQTPEAKLLPACQAKGIGVIARVPFDEGSLTGRINEQTSFPAGDFRNHYFGGDRKRQVAERVAALVRNLDIKTTQLPEIALRFCLSHPAVSTVIPGMRTVRNAEANCGVPDKGPLSAEMLAIVKQHRWDRNFYD